MKRAIIIAAPLIGLLSTTAGCAPEDEALEVWDPQAEGLSIEESYYESYKNLKEGAVFRLDDGGCMRALHVDLRDYRAESDQLYTEFFGSCFEDTTTIDMVRLEEDDTGIGRIFGAVLTPEGDSVMQGTITPSKTLPVLWVQAIPDPSKTEVDVVIQGMILYPEDGSDSPMRFVGTVEIDKSDP